MNSAPSRLMRHWPVIALIVSAAMLAIAHGFETFGGLAPCLLCLKQREVYWLALGVAAVGVGLGLTPIGARLRPLVCIALLLVFLAGAIVAGYHAGAEWKWWPGPSACSGGRGHVSTAVLARLMHGGKFAAPSCEQAAWRWLGLSMAGWNSLISLGLAALSGLAAVRSMTHERS